MYMKLVCQSRISNWKKKKNFRIKRNLNKILMLSHNTDHWIGRRRGVMRDVNCVPCWGVGREYQKTVKFVFVNQKVRKGKVGGTFILLLSPIFSYNLLKRNTCTWMYSYRNWSSYWFGKGKISPGRVEGGWICDISARLFKRSQERFHYWLMWLPTTFRVA